MGSQIFGSKDNQEIMPVKSDKKKRQENTPDKIYDMNVIQVSNIALAIKNKQHTINVQISLRCQNLPIMKTFGSTDSMIVIYKHQDNQDHQNNKKVQIGRTEVVKNQLNPKYIQTFILSFNQQKKQEIQFKIYDIRNQTDDLSDQVLIGSGTVKLDVLVDNQIHDLQIGTGDVMSRKNKAVLKINCVQYDGGNSKYEIGLQVNNFGNKGEVFYVIQVLKLNQWIPIVKSQPLQIKKTPRFPVMEVPYSKFQGLDNSLVKIKIFQITKTKQIEQLGCTDEITIMNIFTNDDKPQNQRVYKAGFVVGVIMIYKWEKIIRDSFISYIVNGARLNLILAIDFSNSNQDQQNLHNLKTKPNGQETNPYIEAIQKIVGLLQYFNFYNGLPLYGFGAKLPPYYQSLRSCFALNGNFFNPIVVGGVEEIIKVYKENLKIVKKHGPTKLSQIIDLAVEYAGSQTQSLNYYVLVVLTDGQINDLNDTVNCILRASCLPISIVLVGLGAKKDFSLFNSLDQSFLKEKQIQNSNYRDIVDFIRLQDFQKDNGSTILARETFAQIPCHFIDYMNLHSIKPNKQKKSLKAAKSEFISQKIKQTKKGYKDTSTPPIPQFLQNKKKQMINHLIHLGFKREDSLLQNLCIASNDLSYFLEVHSEAKRIQSEDGKVFKQSISIKQTKQLEEYLDVKDQENKKKMLEKLQKIQSNQFGRKIKNAKKQNQIKQKVIKPLQHPCLNCSDRQITVLHMQCGHASVCEECAQYRCIICRFQNQQIIKFQFQNQAQCQNVQ